MDVSTPQGPLLHLDVSTQQRPLLYNRGLEVCPSGDIFRGHPRWRAVMAGGAFDIEPAQQRVGGPG